MNCPDGQVVAASRAGSKTILLWKHPNEFAGADCSSSSKNPNARKYWKKSSNRGQ
jgi:hypothetical protein